MGNEKKRHQPVSLEVKNEILEKLRNGSKVKDLAEQYGIHYTTIYEWVNKGAGGKNQELLEISRLKRENESLLKLVGKLVHDQSVGKKS